MKLTDENILELVEKEIEKDTIAYLQTEAVVYQITNKELINFARAILKEAGAEELERDAERYRWLRENLGKTVSHWICTEGGEELDETLDAIMKAK